MPKKKSQLNSKEMAIIMTIHKHGGKMSAHEISEITGISYVTVKKYLEKLKKEEVLTVIGV